MLPEPLTLYKLIILYMLDKVTFPLSNAQISDFLLEKEYTNYLSLQQVLSELDDKGLIAHETYRNRTLITITAEGQSTLQLLENGLSLEIRKDVEEYLRQNELKLRDEVSVLADYRLTPQGDYVANLIAKDRRNDLIRLSINMPTEALADTVCRNWQKKSSEIYQYLTEHLL